MLTPILGPAPMLLAPIGLIALRGCPTCWIANLRAAMAETPRVRPKSALSSRSD